MATSYPDRTNARGIWKLDDITKNIKTEGTWPGSFSDRVLFGAGGTPSGTTDQIESITVSSTGDATDFGNLSVERTQVGGFGSTTRGCWSGGAPDGSTQNNTIDYVNFVSSGNAADFGNLSAARRLCCGSGNNIRGLTNGGYDSSGSNVIDYVTIASTGNAADFGNLSVTRFVSGATANYLRSVVAGGGTPSTSNVIDYVTINTTGNATDFGDLEEANDGGPAGFASSTRGIFCGGTPATLQKVQSIQIASTGNATDFGDLSAARQNLAASSNGVRGVSGGGFLSPAYPVNIDYFQIASAGNASDFGDLNAGNAYGHGCGSSHGGIREFDPDLRFLVTGNRMLIAAGETPTLLNSIEKIEINSLGKSTDFGDMTSARTYPCSPNNLTRGLIYSGYTGSYVNTIDQVEMRSTGNAADFGDSSYYSSSNGGLASHTRSINAGGVGNPGSGVTVWDIIEYNTFATAGNATDFGDLLDVNRAPTMTACNPTRGIFGGGLPQDSGADVLNVIQYITMASTGDASDFGDLSVARTKGSVGGGGMSSATRGVFACGNAPSRSNVMDYITTASTGNATDFGDATVARRGGAAGSSGVRGIIAAGDTPTIIDSIDYITIASTGDAADFGDAATARMFPTGMANGHGGLSG